MKTMLMKTLATMAVVCALALPAAGQTRIGTIDLRKVFDHYWKRDRAQTALHEREAAMDKELKGFMDDYNKTKEEYTALLNASQDQGKSQEERSKSKTAAEAKLMELKTGENTIRTYRENATDQLDSQKKRMRDELLQDIQAAVSAKAKANGYSLVIDTAAESISPTPIVLYTNGENDITDAILAQLNVAAPPPGAADTTPKVGATPDTKKSDKK